MLQDAQLAVCTSSRLNTYPSHRIAIEQVIHVMRTQLQENLTLEDMADIACLSPYYFCRVFHGLVGIPPGEFLSTLRLDAAKRLLLTTSLSVTDICFEVGYVGLGSFTTRFSQLVGVSPRSLRHLANTVSLSPLTTITSNPEQTTMATLFGSISLPDSTQRTSIFVGLFTKPIPQGKPVRCTNLSAPGGFQITGVPDGRYYLLVAAMPVSCDLRSYLLPEKLWVGMQGPLVVKQHKNIGPLEIVLRPTELTDPPIIAALPFLSKR